MKYNQFPPFPRSRAEIFDYPGRGEYLACAIVRNTSVRQLMAFRKLRIALGEPRFGSWMTRIAA